MATPKKTPVEFNEARLKELAEPITVSVEKNINGRKMPIQLPAKPGEGSGGTGLSREEVRQVGNWIATEGTGGGLYFFRAVGDNGQEMRWEYFYPPNIYPERAPSGAQIQSPPPGQSQAPWMQSYTAGAPGPWAPPPPMTGPFPGTAGFGVPWGGQPQMGYQTSSPWSTGAPPDLRVAKLEAQIDRDRQNYAHQQEMSRIAEELRKLQSSPNGKDDATVRELKEQIARLEAAGRDDKLGAQLQAMQAQTMEMIRGITQSTQDQIRAMQEQTRQVMEEARRAAEEAKRSGPDPTITLLVEQQRAAATAGAEAARISAEAQKEIARLQAETQKEAARTAIGPNQVIDLVTKMTSGHEHVDKAWGMMEKGFEMMLQAQGPPISPAVQILGEGLQGALQTAQQYLQSKEQADMAQARAQQAQAMAMQRNAQVAQAAQQHQLSEAPAVANAMAPEVVEAQQQAAVAAEEVDKQELQLFGPAVEAIRRMRLGVANKELSPEQAADAVFKGIDYFAKQEAEGRGAVPPVFNLWREGEVARMIETILPDATTAFVEQTIQALFAIVETIKKAHAKQAQQVPQAEESSPTIEVVDEPVNEDGVRMGPV